MRFPKEKEKENTKNVTLLNKIQKANEKFYFYCKKPGYFTKNCLKKKNDEKEKVNQASKDQEQMFVAALTTNDLRHTICCNPSFGLATKAKGLQGCGPRKNPRVKAKKSQGCGP
jgi:hypothetical protein